MKRYDVHMGRKLVAHAERAGFRTRVATTLPDRELAFDGPADPGVVDAWRRRLDRMTLLRAFCGPELDAVRDDFLACLGREDHVARAKVHFVVAEAA